jgi:hypothetical protein
LLGCLDVVSVGNLDRWSCGGVVVWWCGGVVDVGAAWFSGGVEVVSGGAGINYGGVVGSVCLGGD